MLILDACEPAGALHNFEIYVRYIYIMQNLSFQFGHTLDLRERWPSGYGARLRSYLNMNVLVGKPGEPSMEPKMYIYSNNQ